MLKVKQLSKVYTNQKGIFNVSFECAPSEVMGIIGDNGSGKSTLFKCLAHINGYDKGLIELNAQPLQLKDVGFLPEHKAIIEELTAMEFVELFAKMKGCSEEQRSKSIQEFSERLHTFDIMHQKIKHLSKGNKQKIQIMATCIHEPQLIILDEPFSGLDDVNHSHMKNFIVSLKEKNKIVLLSSHRLEDIEHVCDSVCWIKDGKLSEKYSIYALKEDSSLIHVKVSFDPYQQFKDEKGIISVVNEGNVSVYCFDQVSQAHQFMKLILKQRKNQSVSIHHQVMCP